MGELGYGRSKGLGKQLVKELKKIVLRTQQYKKEKLPATAQKPVLFPLFPEEGTFAVLLSEWKQTTQGEWMSS